MLCTNSTFISWVIIMKVFFFLYLLVLVYLNLMDPISNSKIQQYPKDETNDFIVENILVGFFAALSTAYICWSRNISLKTTAIYFALTFFLIIAINVLFQYSGIYNLMYCTKDCLEFDLVTKVINLIYATLFVTGLCILIFLTLWTFDSKNAKIFINKYYIPKMIIEMLIFTISYTLPSFYISYNRRGKLHVWDVYGSIITFFAFILVYMLLQISGIFSSLGLRIFTKK